MELRAKNFRMGLYEGARLSCERKIWALPRLVGARQLKRVMPVRTTPTQDRCARRRAWRVFQWAIC
jgi:hypothetical protein